MVYRTQDPLAVLQGCRRSVSGNGIRVLRLLYRGQNVSFYHARDVDRRSGDTTANSLKQVWEMQSAISLMDLENPLCKGRGHAPPPLPAEQHIVTLEGA